MTLPPSHRPVVAVSTVPRTLATGYGPDLGDTIANGLVAGVVAADGVPVALPVVAPELAPAQLAAADALVLSGGQDVALAGHRDGQWVDPRRDRHEAALWAAAREGGLPILGVCRGLQLANVLLGGTLLTDVAGHDAAARHAEDQHQVELLPGRRLAAIFGGADAVAVNTIHHQALDRVAAGLVVSARAADGTVEAAETVAGDGWFVGVQWHPELMLDRPGGQRLFDALVAAVGAGSAA